MSCKPRKADKRPPPPAVRRKPQYGTTGTSSTKVQTKKSVCEKKAATAPPAPPKEFELPPLSIPLKVKELTEGQKELIEWRKKTARRLVPEGEDLKKINEIIKTTKGQDITVQEFVGLISPYTGDKGTFLRTAMDAELASFRRMAKKVYETMTQDVSDVLANEQIQLMSSYKEKHSQYSDKMMRSIDEIFYHVPEFDFERYFRDPAYLSVALPIPEEKLSESDDEEENIRKQEAFHRMEWLRAEGERLQNENRRLQKRLREVKNLQKSELEKAAETEQEVERRRCELVNEQNELKDRLDDLNQTLEKTVICGETAAMNMDKEKRKCTQGKPAKGKRVKSAIREKPPWNVTTAREVDLEGAETLVSGDKAKIPLSGSVSSQASLASVKKKKSAVKKKKWDFSRPKMPQETSPFHYSPPRTPPGECPKPGFSGWF